MRSDRWFVVWFIVTAVLALGWLAFMVWAIASLVSWVTAQ